MDSVAFFDSVNEDLNAPPREFGVFVSDIARGTSDEQLKNAFSEIGPVYAATVVKNKYTGETKGYGFVQFFSMDDVHKALDWQNLPSFTDKVSGKVQTVKITIADPKNTLHVGNIPRNIGEEEVKKTIQEIAKAPLTKFELSTNVDGSSKGFGWATFANHDHALQAMKNLQKTEFMGVSLNVSLAEPRAFDPRILDKVKTLFVKGVAPGVSSETLQSILGPDVVERVVIPLDSVKKTPLGHAFVHCKTREDAEYVMNKFSGFLFEGRKLSIEWCLPPGTRRAKTPKKPGIFPPGVDQTHPWGNTHPYYYWQQQQQQQQQQQAYHQQSQPGVAAPLPGAPPVHPAMMQPTSAGHPALPHPLSSKGTVRKPDQTYPYGYDPYVGYPPPVSTVPPVSNTAARAPAYPYRYPGEEYTYPTEQMPTYYDAHANLNTNYNYGYPQSTGLPTPVGKYQAKQTRDRTERFHPY